MPFISSLLGQDLNTTLRLKLEQGTSPWWSSGLRLHSPGLKGAWVLVEGYDPKCHLSPPNKNVLDRADIFDIALRKNLLFDHRVCESVGGGGALYLSG